MEDETRMSMVIPEQERPLNLCKGTPVTSKFQETYQARPARAILESLLTVQGKSWQKEIKSFEQFWEILQGK